MTILGWVFFIFIGLVILSLLVFVHELGHFLLARFVGVRVITFSIGFGRKLFSWMHRGTEYCVSALPFGGYVKLSGQEPGDEPSDAADDYRNKKIWQRACIVGAGPAANYLFALLILWLIYMAGVRERIDMEDLRIGGFADSSTAAMAGMEIGDRILSLDGKAAKNWEQFYSIIAVSGGRALKMELQRKGEKIAKTVTPAKIQVQGIGTIGDVGIYSVEKPVVGQVFDSSAAAEAGIRAGDTVLAVNRAPVLSWGQMVTIVRKMDKPGIFTVKRGQTLLDFNITPRYIEKEKRHVIGVVKAMPDIHTHRYGPITAAGKAFEKSNDMIYSMWAIVRGFFHKSISPRSMAGPVGIVQMTASAARMGFDTLCFFIALISINLAIINLLPLAITDGGVLLFLGLEKLRGRALGQKLQMQIQRVAIVLLIALFLFVTLNDFQRLFG